MKAEAAQLLRLDAHFVRAAEALRVLPALSADNAASERARLVACALRGEFAEPKWTWRRARLPVRLNEWIDEARGEARRTPVEAAYLAKLDELELDAALLDALGDPKRVRPLALRRYGSGRDLVPTGAGDVRAATVAHRMLDTVEGEAEPRVVEAPAVAAFLLTAARSAGLDIDVRIEPKLAAAAAAGDRVLWIAARKFGEREVRRLAAHEVLGHLVAAANGRAQPMRLLEHGTAGSFTDQEGLAIYLEEQTGTLDAFRMRVLAARVLAADAMFAGAAYGEVVRTLMREHGFAAFDAVTLTERAYRGGGVARDCVYLVGWLRVKDAIESGEASLDELRAGKVSLDVVPMLRAWRKLGLARPALLRPGVAARVARSPGDLAVFG